DARHLALELRPPELDDVGLESALETYVAQWSSRYGTKVDLSVIGPAADEKVPGHLGTMIYRVVQEALTNVAKHAQAGHVTVILNKHVDVVRLVIEDDGTGFDPSATARKMPDEQGFGIAGMRERATLVGGTLEVETSAGRGTTVYARVPLQAVVRPNDRP